MADRNALANGLLNYMAMPEGSGPAYNALAMPSQSLSAYDPTWRDRIANALMGNQRTSPEYARLVEGLIGSRGLGSTGMGLLDLTPAGVPMQAQEALRGGDDRALAMALMPGAKGLKGLDLSPEARLSRANAAYRPETVYHGTRSADDFTAFDLARSGQTTGSRAAQEGVSVSPSPRVADEFAFGVAPGASEHSRVLPLRYRSDNRAVLTLDKEAKNNEVAATLKTAWDQGYDSVVLRNYSTPGGLQNQTVIVVKDPAQLRSVNAEFDPARINENNLMAGLAGASVVPATLFYDQAD